jgi:hypothetical protein
LLAPLLDIPLPEERVSTLAPEELRRRQLAALTNWVMAGAKVQPDAPAPSGLAGQGFVYTKDFAAYGRIDVARGLDRFDNADCAALLHLRADARELNSSHLVELFLSVVCYPNGSDTVLDDDVLVIPAVFNLHEGPRHHRAGAKTLPSSHPQPSQSIGDSNKL